VKKRPARPSVRKKHAKAPAAASHRTGTRARKNASAPRGKAKPVEAVPVTADDLRLLQRELARRMAKGSGARAAGTKSPPVRWNPDPEDVQKSVAQLVLTVVEFLRKLMERQAVRRMEANTLTPEEVEAVGTALMRLEETVRDLGRRFGLEADDLNLDLGPIKLM
jgi:hypothetical protein